MQIKLSGRPETPYSEVGQVSKVKFSMGHIENDTVIEWFYPVKCRDFLCDVVISRRSAKELYVYYFRTNPDWPVEESVLILTSTDSKQLDNIVANAEWIDSCFKNKTSFKYERISNDTLVLLNGQQFYTVPWAISLLTCVLRYAGYQVNPPAFTKGFTFVTPEVDYIKQVDPNQFQKLLDNCIKLIDLVPGSEYGISGYPNDPVLGYDNISFLHNYSGFKNVFTYGSNFYKEALNAM